MRFIFLIIFLISNIYANTNKDFTLYKKDGTTSGHTLLIIGGIHGDEPGGYFAPAFLEKYYSIKILKVNGLIFMIFLQFQVEVEPFLVHIKIIIR